MENVEENNKLIAEFMGIYPFSKSGQYEALNIITALEFNMNTNFFNSPTDVLYIDDFKFHESWDWLMPVIEKIESMGYYMKMTKKSCAICTDSAYKEKIIASELLKGRFENLYSCIITFIKFYSKEE